MKRRVTFTKACDCKKATASGPRYVLQSEPEAGGCRIWSYPVALACDKCDTPWTVPAASPTPDKASVKIQTEGGTHE